MAELYLLIQFENSFRSCQMLYGFPDTYILQNIIDYGVWWVFDTDTFPSSPLLTSMVGFCHGGNMLVNHDGDILHFIF